jgi:hypothetical protein
MTPRVHAMRRARAGRSGARRGTKLDRRAVRATRRLAHDDEAAPRVYGGQPRTRLIEAASAGGVEETLGARAAARTRRMSDKSRGDGRRRAHRLARPARRGAPASLETPRVGARAHPAALARPVARLRHGSAGPAEEHPWPASLARRAAWAQLRGLAGLGGRSVSRRQPVVGPRGAPARPVGLARRAAWAQLRGLAGLGGRSVSRRQPVVGPPVEVACPGALPGRAGPVTRGEQARPGPVAARPAGRSTWNPLGANPRPGSRPGTAPSALTTQIPAGWSRPFEPNFVP